MKKTLLIIGLALSLMACTPETTNETEQTQKAEAPKQVAEETEQTEVETEIQTEEETVQDTEDQPPVNIDDIMPNMDFEEPNSVGAVYMITTYTNNSPYPITSYSLTYVSKDTNEKRYAQSYDTVMPGETSPNMSSLGPDTMTLNDVDLLELEITAVDGNDEYHIEYDFKLNRVEWYKR